jgi:hypothetical protein
MSVSDFLRFGRCAAHPCRDLTFEGKVFLCYRKDDTEGAVRDLRRRLVARKIEVFSYEESLGPGLDYRDEIRQELESCSAALVVIGQVWLTVEDEDGVRCITKQSDILRQEVEQALEAHGRLRTVPVLVYDAKMPTSAQLPESIARLAYRNAQTIRADHQEEDTNALIDHLKGAPKSLFAKFDDIKLAAPPLPLLVGNALLRPFWSNVLLPLALVLAGFLISGAWWLVPVGVVLWLVLGAVTLFDRRQLRCAERCFQAAMPSAEPVELSVREEPARVE